MKKILSFVFPILIISVLVGVGCNKPSVQTNPVQDVVKKEVKCESAWSCSGWSSCNNEIQKRTCVDKNKCNKSTNKPDVEKKCLMKKTTTIKSVKQPTKTAIVAGSPIDVYLSSLKDTEQVKTLEEVFAVIKKYDSIKNVSQKEIEDSEKTAAKMSEEEKKQAVAVFKGMEPKYSTILAIKNNIKQTIDGNKATLYMKFTDKGLFTGEDLTREITIKMIKEDGVWKIYEEIDKES